MFRFMLAAFALIPLTFSQSLPAIRWVAEVDGSGKDSFAGLGVDAQGNTYIAGSTYSASFPVKAAVQNRIASAGLYRIDGPGTVIRGPGSYLRFVYRRRSSEWKYSLRHLCRRASQEHRRGDDVFNANALPSSQAVAIATSTQSTISFLYARYPSIKAY